MKRKPAEQSPNAESSEALRAKTDKLVSAALSMTRAIELLTSAELMGQTEPPDVSRGIDFYREVSRFETVLIIEALRFCQGNQARAAKLLRLNSTTLNCMIKKYKISPKLIGENTSMALRFERERGRSNESPQH